MTYKLNPEVKKICAPVIIRFADKGEELTFPDGASLADVELDKYYLISSLTTEDNAVVLSLCENDRVNAMNWAGEEAVSFF